jgi:hypothetical protein
MPNTVSNYGYYTGISPTVWSEMVQQPLRKKLVSLAVCNTRLADKLTYGKAIQLPKFNDVSAKVYTPGTDMSATNQIWTYDTINISTYKYCMSYIDDVEKLQSNVAVQVELAGDAAYQLKDAIDSFAFSKITGGTSVGISAVSRNTVFADSSTGVITAASTNIIDLFAGVTKVLRLGNVEEDGDWVAVVTPTIANYIEVKAASTGFNVSDATLRNGYVGPFMGYKVYLSNNLPSGVVSALAPSTIGGPSAAGSATTGHSMLFGKRGVIDLILQKAPAMELRKPDSKIGVNLITWTVYGAGVSTKNRGRARNVTVKSA